MTIEARLGEAHLPDAQPPSIRTSDACAKIAICSLRDSCPCCSTDRTDQVRHRRKPRHTPMSYGSDRVEVLGAVQRPRGVSGRSEAGRVAGKRLNQA